MNLLEFENQQFPGTWDKETIKELKESKPHKDSGTSLGSEPDGYTLYEGKYLADNVMY